MFAGRKYPSVHLRGEELLGRLTGMKGLGSEKAAGKKKGQFLRG
jgi:hypothetical protein